MLLDAALAGRYELLLSVPLALEYEAVLTRAPHLMKSGLSERNVHDLLDAVIAVARQVHLHFRWRPALNDPDDDMVLETAVNGGADVLVTANIRDFAVTSKKFGIEAVLPKQAWKRVSVQ